MAATPLVQPGQIPEIARRAINYRLAGSPAYVNTAADTGVSMGITFELRQGGASDPSAYASLWPLATVHGFVVTSARWTSANTLGGGEAPAATRIDIVENNGTDDDAVAHMALAICNTDGGSIFGGNDVIVANATGVVARGREIDIQSGDGTSFGAGSIALPMNVGGGGDTGADNIVAGIQFGSIDGTTRWQNCLIFGYCANAMISVLSTDPITAVSGVDLRNGDFSDAAFQSTGFHVDNTGKIKNTGMPTSSAGLAAGTLWNDSGTVKVA